MFFLPSPNFKNLLRKQIQTKCQMFRWINCFSHPIRLSWTRDVWDLSNIILTILITLLTASLLMKRASWNFCKLSIKKSRREMRLLKNKRLNQVLVCKNGRLKSSRNLSRRVNSYRWKLKCKTNTKGAKGCFTKCTPTSWGPNQRSFRQNTWDKIQMINQMAQINQSQPN